MDLVLSGTSVAQLVRLSVSGRGKGEVALQMAGVFFRCSLPIFVYRQEIYSRHYALDALKPTNSSSSWFSILILTLLMFSSHVTCETKLSICDKIFKFGKEVHYIYKPCPGNTIELGLKDTMIWFWPIPIQWMSLEGFTAGVMDKTNRNTEEEEHKPNSRRAGIPCHTGGARRKLLVSNSPIKWRETI